jgi:hypothetical protein
MATAVGTSLQTLKREFAPAAVEAFLKRSRRWRISEDLLREPTVEPPAIQLESEPGKAAWKPTPFLASTLSSVGVHLLILLAAAWLAVDITSPPEATWLTAQPLASNEEPQEIVALAPAEITANAKSDEPSSIATFTTVAIDPGAMHGAAPKIELSDVGATWRTALADSPGLTEEPGDGQAAAGSGSGGAGGDPDGDDKAEFFGVSASGRKFVFVCDCSRSMTGQKWIDLHREIERCIENLSERQSFYIIFFDGDMHPMFAPEFQAPSLLPATEENVDQTRLWLSSVPLGPNTSPFESMKFALTLEPDAIFLLTDGAFSDYTAPYLRDFHRKRRTNQEPGVVVHTIGFYDKRHQMVLERIARESEGIYRFVESPHATRPKRRSQNVYAPPPGKPIVGPPVSKPRDDG